ncbi:MAG: hypothetical protein ABI904_12790 [Chloroflexota bacterium]
MNLVTFLSNNSQSLFTLGGVFLGSVITFLISYLNNRFQAKEREKDRNEQRREVKIQTKEKIIGGDILKLMDSIEVVLKILSSAMNLFSNYENIDKRKEYGLLTPTEAKKKMISLDNEMPSIYDELNTVLNAMNRLIFSFAEEEILENFKDFMQACQVYFGELLKYIDSKSGGESPEKNNISIIKVSQAAGKLQRALRDKLISLRD